MRCSHSTRGGFCSPQVWAHFDYVDYLDVSSQQQISYNKRQSAQVLSEASLYGLQFSSHQPLASDPYTRFCRAQTASKLFAFSRYITTSLPT